MVYVRSHSKILWIIKHLELDQVTHSVMTMSWGKPWYTQYFLELNTWQTCGAFTILSTLWWDGKAIIRHITGKSDCFDTTDKRVWDIYDNTYFCLQVYLRSTYPDIKSCFNAIPLSTLWSESPTSRKNYLPMSNYVFKTYHVPFCLLSIPKPVYMFLFGPNTFFYFSTRSQTIICSKFHLYRSSRCDVIE